MRCGEGWEEVGGEWPALSDDGILLKSDVGGRKKVRGMMCWR